MRDQLAAELEKNSGDTPQEPVATEATTEQVETESEAEQPVVQTQEAPAHWPAEKREMFAKLPVEAQDFLLSRHKEMEADYTRKSQELAEQRRPYEEFDRIFGPYKQQLELTGKSPVQVVQQLLAAQRMLDTNPSEGIRWIAQSYNLDLSNLVQKNEEYTDPELQKLRNEINQLRSERQQEAQRAQQAQSQSAQKVIADFRDAKNADGSPKYPHFDKLQTLMGPLVGQGKTLEQAYDIVKYTLPEEIERVKSEVAKTAQAEQARKAEEARKLKAKEAKGATQVIRSRGNTAEESSKPGTIREELSKAWKELQTGRI